jgi:hypothetical protein
MKLAALALTLTLPVLFAQSKAGKAPAKAAPKPAAKKEEAHGHGAHEHGKAKLSLAFEGTKGTIEFESPAESIVGFEHKPKNADEKKKVDAAMATLKARVGEMVMLPAAAGCKITAKEVEMHQDGDHAEFHAEYNVNCAKPVSGEVRFGISKVFPSVNEVEVQALSDKGQSGATIKQDKGVIKIA